MPSERILTHRGVVITVLTGDASDASYTLLHYQAPPGFAGVQLHHHRETTEWFYVLAGTMVWMLNGREGKAGTGGFVEVKPGVVHVWRNGSIEHPIRMLIGFDRPGFDGYFRDLIALAASSPVWPPADPTQLMELGRRFDTFS
jgi:mannose-6-phosphate isomerase-like protein (cupin superfamily)